MTDPLSLALAVAAALVAVGIGWVQWPRPPSLDGERWFKLMLATLLRGRVEHEGGDAALWERTVIRLVPYGDNAAATDQLLDDPGDLGQAYDPQTYLGHGLGWDALARHPADDSLAVAFTRLLSARWILVEGRSDRLVGPTILPALAAELRDEAIVVPFGDGLPERLEEVATQAATGVSDRLVFAGEEAGVARLMQLLHTNAALRDKVVAVVSIGGVIGGRDDEDGPYGRAARADWLGASFVQRELETDVVRLTPWLSVQWLGARGLPIAAQRFPEPDAEGATARTLEVVDLGPLPIDPALDPAIVARALVAITTLWVASRR